MNDEEDFTRLRIHVHDHFLEQGPDQTLLETYISVRAIPHSLQVGGQIFELLSRGCRDLLLPQEMLIDALFDLVDALQGLVPAPLLFVSHQTVFRVGRVVLLLCALRDVARRLQIPSPGVQHFVLLTRSPFARDHGRLDCCWLHHAQDFFSHRRVYRHAAKPDAARFAVVQRASRAHIPEHIMSVASVPDHQLSAAAPAPQEPG